jgi:hypothetical protein
MSSFFESFSITKKQGHSISPAQVLSHGHLCSNILPHIYLCLKNVNSYQLLIKFTIIISFIFITNVLWRGLKSWIIIFFETFCVNRLLLNIVKCEFWFLKRAWIVGENESAKHLRWCEWGKMLRQNPQQIRKLLMTQPEAMRSTAERVATRVTTRSTTLIRSR